jgi:hypothetical protein
MPPKPKYPATLGLDLAGATDRAGIQLWLYNYCKAHPLDGLGSAVDALIIKLHPAELYVPLAINSGETREWTGEARRSKNSVRPRSNRAGYRDVSLPQNWKLR